MKKVTISTDELAETLVASYKLNTEEQHLQNCHAYMVLFDEEFYKEASNKAIQTIMLEQSLKNK